MTSIRENTVSPSRIHQGKLERPNGTLLLEGAVLAIFSICAFNLICLISTDIFPRNPISQCLYLVYYVTYGRIIPPLGHAYGINCTVYLLGCLAAYAYLNRKKGTVTNLLETLRLGTVVVLVFEVILFLFGPAWRDAVVVYAQIGTQFQWFTNDYLLGVTCFALPSIELLLHRHRREVYPA